MKDIIKKHKVIFIVILAIVLILILVGIIFSFRKSDTLFLSGRLEGYETDIGPKYGGQITYIVAREGTRVKKGQLLIKILDSELQAQLKAANANISISQQQARQALLQLSVINNQIKQAKLSVFQSNDDSKGTVEQATASLASAQLQYSQAEDQLKQAESEFSLATKDFNRYSNLLTTNSIPKQVYDQSKTKYDNAKANLQLRTTGLVIAKKQIEQAQGLLIQSHSSAYNPFIKQEQVSLLYSQLKQGKSQLAAAKSSILQSKASKQEILAKIAYLNIRSPIDGVIIARTSEPGQVVSVGKTILTLLDYNTVYMRGYIPEGKIGLIRIGQKARVYLDSSPDKPFSAKVSEIDDEASFTPENIYFKDDRVKQVFGIKLNIEDPQGFAKPGMPVDAEIVLEKDNPKKKVALLKW